MILIFDNDHNNTNDNNNNDNNDNNKNHNNNNNNVKTLFCLGVSDGCIQCSRDGCRYRYRLLSSQHYFTGSSGPADNLRKRDPRFLYD